MIYSKKYFQVHTDHYFKEDLSKIPSFVWIKKELAFRSGEKILDAGCGTGYLLQFVCSGEKGVGVDISGEALKMARELFPQHKFIKADMAKLPFSNEYFDKIFSFNVIEHLEDQEKAMGELKRVLKKGGIIVLGTNIKDSLSWRLFKFFLGGDPTHKREFTTSEFVDFVRKYFEILKMDKSSCVGRYPRLVRLLFHKFLKGDILVKARKK